MYLHMTAFPIVHLPLLAVVHMADDCRQDGYVTLCQITFGHLFYLELILLLVALVEWIHLGEIVITSRP